MMNVLLIAVGGFFGAISRFYVSKRMNQSQFKLPYGTLTINLLGSFFLGLLIGENIQGGFYALMGTGFLGAFTTFSTLTIESLQLLEKKERAQAGLYLLLTYLGGIAAGFLGLILGRL